MTEQQQNVALLVYISFFGFLCAVLIVREGRVGWALTLKNLAYTLVFGLAVAAYFWPWLRDDQLWLAIRWALGAALTWATAELIRLWWQRPRTWLWALEAALIVAAAGLAVVAVVAFMRVQ